MAGPGAVRSVRNDGPQCVEALIGEEHGDVFEAGPPVLVAHGPDCYAPALLWAPGNRWLLWGWSWEARDEAWAVADGWAGVLTLPREIHVDDNGHTAPAARRRTPDVGKSADAPRRRVGISPRLQRSARWPLDDITLALPLWQAGRAPVGAR
ncbi:hypothetical protein [Streptomyces sp. BBFR102]|uniref:hypothetical protein n=1 Tax=Streptomyces sp. BBFR102 TaxID=3448171 RepID=UPI003F53CAD7